VVGLPGPAAEVRVLVGASDPGPAAVSSDEVGPDDAQRLCRNPEPVAYSTVQPRRASSSSSDNAMTLLPLSGPPLMITSVFEVLARVAWEAWTAEASSVTGTASFCMDPR
jgi:hypothetical protein